MQFDESKHPRDADGKFTAGNATAPMDKTIGELKAELTKELPDKQPELAEISKKKTTPVKVNMDAEIQKQFDKATPKERTKIAYNYIMNNLRGKYAANDGRMVAIERVGAKEITHTLYEPKIRVTPELAKLIETGNLIDIKNADHSKFKQFAYYSVDFQMGNDVYNAVINVGIRDDGSSTLYDINQFKKQ